MECMLMASDRRNVVRDYIAVEIQAIGHLV